MELSELERTKSYETDGPIAREIAAVTPYFPFKVQLLSNTWSYFAVFFASSLTNYFRCRAFLVSMIVSVPQFPIHVSNGWVVDLSNVCTSFSVGGFMKHPAIFQKVIDAFAHRSVSSLCYPPEFLLLSLFPRHSWWSMCADQGMRIWISHRSGALMHVVLFSVTNQPSWIILNHLVF